jgi:hypothetical protein
LSVTAAICCPKINGNHLRRNALARANLFI